MEIVGILLERHRDHIVLSNGTRILLKEGVSASRIPIGRSMTVTCTVQGGKKLAHSIRLNPDWLLDALEAATPPRTARPVPVKRAPRRRTRFTSPASRLAS
jgi:hypothetical protein